MTVLALRVAHLAHVWTASLDLGELVRPILRSIWEHTGETVALFVPHGAYRTCIAELPSSQPLSFKRGIGYREHVVVGASGRAILAFAAINGDDLQEYAKGTDVDLTKYPQELALIRKRGYATSKDELIQGAIAIAAPFFNAGGQVAGSVAAFGPSARLHAKQIDEFGKLLVSEAASISQALGQRRHME